MKPHGLYFVCCLVVVCALSGAFSASAQQPGLAQHLKELHDRAFAIVQAERDNAKKMPCQSSSNTADTSDCWGKALDITNDNYLKLVRALGALLRAGDASQTKPSRIPFDDGETAWQSYRTRFCDAYNNQYEGGTIRGSIEHNCSMVLTHSHIEELWSLYSDLGTH